MKATLNTSAKKHIKSKICYNNHYRDENLEVNKLERTQRKEVELNTSEIELQKDYIRKINNINNIEFNRSKKQRLYTLVTYGCQMNSHDSEKISGMLTEMGYKETKDETLADVIVYNTCCVRENAENKIYGNLGFLKGLKTKNKNLKIVLCGCMMQQDLVIEKIKLSYKYVDVIFGTYNLYRFPELLYTSIESGSQIIDVWKEHGEIIEDLPSIRLYPFKASVNIMYGCNNFCTYCIVPYVRGRERSREVLDIIREVKKLVNDGVKEITLLGQNVNSYGKTLDTPVSFASLILNISKIEGLERIRFMTSHPKDLSDELIEVIRDCDKVCKHIHLPFQSGSNQILKKMGRNYTKESYLQLINKIKKEIPNILFTTDIIVGFPTETDEDNDETIAVVKEVMFSNAYTFLYSIRSGTPAANLKGQVPEHIAKERFNKLLDVLKPICYEINKRQVGTLQKVLVENVSKNDKSFLSGRLDNNTIVHFKGDKNLIGEIIDIKITDCKTFYLTGEKI